MSRSQRWVFYVGAVATVLLTCQIWAQDYVYATGSPNFGVNYPIPSGFVNVTNGNAHASIPLGTFNQRGNLPPIKISLEYDSRIWQITDNGGYSWQPVNVPNSMAGWRLTTGLEQGSVAYSQLPVSTQVSCAYDYTIGVDSYTYTDFSWTDGQGTKHVFDGSITESYQNFPPPSQCYEATWTNPGPGAGSANIGYAIDSSGYFLHVDNYTQMTVYDSSGNEVYPIHQDANGNTVSMDTNGTITDSMGRTLLTTTNNGSSITYNVLKTGGGTKAYTVYTEPISINTSFQQSAVSEYSGTLTGVQSVGLPDGSSYSFTYDSGTSGNYGEMQSMTLPTGGVVSFGYENYLDSYNNVNRWIITEQQQGSGFAYFTPAVLTQCSSGGVNCQEKMTLTRSSGDSKVYTLTLNDGAWDGQTDTYQGSTKLMTVLNNYDFQSYQCSNSAVCNGAEYITASSSSVQLDDTGQIAQTLYCYSSAQMGKVSSVKEFDYGVPANAGSTCSSSTPSRETDYTYGYYLNGAALLTQTTQNYNGMPFAQTVYTYDTNNHGNLISKATGGVSGGPQATTSYTYDSNGMKTSVVDPDQHPATTYTYACNDGILSNTTEPTVNNVAHVDSVTPDCNTGDPVVSYDQNANPTRYGYDSIGRKASITYPDTGATSYNYPTANQVVESHLISAGVSATTTTNWDSFGRKASVTTADPAGDVTVTNTYDGDNRLQCTTNAQRTSSSSTDGTTCFSYDALDRPTLITQPDGSQIQVSYVGNQATVVDENGNQKRYFYDAFHNLTQVFEPNTSGALAWETDYVHDPAGHLTSIVQKGDGSSAARVRSFSYDDLGRLQQQTTPESGTKNYTYDLNGNLQTSTTGRGTISYQYDALNRMTLKSGNGLNYIYWYDTVSGTPPLSNTIGRLVAASNDTNADEVFSYDTMGRVNWQASWTPTSPNNTSIITQATYDLAGDVASVTYPDGRVVTQTYDEAQHLTDVQYSSWNGQPANTSYYSNPTFAPTGQTTSASLGNGVQIAASYGSRQTVASLSYATANQTLWSKQYVWANNAKNLLQIDDVLNPAASYNYTYDTVNRLASANGGGQTLVSPAQSGTGSLNISGSDRVTFVRFCPPSAGTYRPICTEQKIYDSGVVTLQVASLTVRTWYNENSTPSSIASDLVTAVNNDSQSPVSANASGSTISLTAKKSGSFTNYTLSATSASSGTTYFSGTSFPVTTSGTALAGGANSVSSGPGTLAETYTPDPWGNLQQSGNFSFQQQYAANNQIAGAGYDGAGDITSDYLGNNYTYDIQGMLTSSNGAQYVYDALQQRVEKTGGSFPEETIYFDGRPIALLSASGGGWTDLIWAGQSLIGEVAGNQTALPVYRLLDHEGSLALTTDGSGNVMGSNDYTPYGQMLSSTTNDPYVFTGLSADSEYGGDNAWYRNYSAEQSRWLRPDPYNGSYDLMNPQSFNRYMYVNGNPLGYVDPSGLAGAGVLTGIGGSPCKTINGTGGSSSFSGISIPVGGGFSINPCDPLASLASIGVVAAINGIWGSGTVAFSEFTPYVGAAITVLCSAVPDLHSNQALCGGKGLTSLIPGNWGTAAGDIIAVAGAYFCATGGPTNPGCIAFAIYTLTNDILSWLGVFDGPQFTGSLLPRPSDLGGLGTAPIGIPNQNLSTSDILVQRSGKQVPSPGMFLNGAPGSIQ